MDYNPLQPVIDAVLALVSVGIVYGATFLTIKLRAMRKELVDNRVKLDTAEIAQTEQIEKVTANTEVLSLMQTRLDKVEEAHRDLLSEHIQLQRKYTQSIERDLEREKRISELELSLASTAQQQTALEAENKDLRRENTELRETNTGLQTEIKALRSELETVKTLIQGKFVDGDC
jgi:chromosome segregation ATPase